MKPRPALPPGPYLVVGLARSGEAAALALRARGETVIGCDAGSAERSTQLAAAAGRLSAAGVELHLDASGDALAASAGTLVKSPGVPPTAPAVSAARSLGVPVVGELELAWRLVPNEFIAVTGTNGKTTTTEWIGHIHCCAGAPAVVAGNVGTALASLVGSLPTDATVVCEASSFQLEDSVAFSPEAAVLLNLSPDHLDRHGSFEDYVAAKLRIFANQTADDVAVTPLDLDLGRSAGAGRSIRFGDAPAAQLELTEDALLWEGDALIRRDEVRLPGAHNLQNAMAAAAVSLARGLPADAVAEGLRSFGGVPHRLELVGQRAGVSFVNDSKATNVASTTVALQSYGGGVHLIAGGDGKGQDFSPLAALVRERCAGVYLIGAASPAIECALAAAGAPLLRCGDLTRAVHEASARARRGETVLLSPACASFDQYPNFEVRGEHFRSLVAALPDTARTRADA